MGTDDVTETVAELHDHLTATRELPVERTASRWIGEAEAVVGDLRGETDREVLHRRVGHVVDLLGNVETTGSDEADDHLAAAKRLAAAVVERTE